MSVASCLSRRAPVVSVGDDFSLPPKTAWLLRFIPVFRTGSSGFRGLLLRTPTARSVQHTSATRRLCWQKLSSCLSGFTWRTRFARQTLVAEVLRTGWHAWRSRPLPGAGSLVRRRSTSASSFLRDDRARVGATPSARPGRHSEASLRAQAPKPCESRFGARSRPRE